ncbi:hypothetical protein GALMADRAFT_216247 [Galerina marginata CBS 339.88]|uniref:Uncharacterized protein n=1 Tax=Galerina marginata (strain CBS 339.88) TaxID=685588 RepID=A0A067S9T6_GALM3|nr:hypothetical protein GALMADRAFT_216247 [Galerina marginata CBS 339.88]
MFCRPVIRDKTGSASVRNLKKNSDEKPRRLLGDAVDNTDDLRQGILDTQDTRVLGAQNMLYNPLAAIKLLEAIGVISKAEAQKAASQSVKRLTLHSFGKSFLPSDPARIADNLDAYTSLWHKYWLALISIRPLSLTMDSEPIHLIAFRPSCVDKSKALASFIRQANTVDLARNLHSAEMVYVPSLRGAGRLERLQLINHRLNASSQEPRDYGPSPTSNEKPQAAVDPIRYQLWTTELVMTMMEKKMTTTVWTRKGPQAPFA